MSDQDELPRYLTCIPERCMEAHEVHLCADVDPLLTAKDARIEDLRDALDFATSGLALILADVRLGITVDADILDLRMECLKALKENADE